MTFFSGGGLSADLATYTLNGLHGFVAVTCLTALTEKGFEVFPTDDVIFQHELDSLRDVEFGGIKIGLLPTVSVAEKALDFIKQRPGVPVVLDPVLVCKETHDVAVSELCQELIRFFPHVSVITPNLPEAELLAGQEINTLEDMKTAAQKLHALGAPAVIIKGGNRLSQDKAVDVFYDGQTFTVLENPVIQGKMLVQDVPLPLALSSHLVKGDELLPAVESSKAFVYRAIAQADQYGVRQYEADKNTKIALVSLLTALSVVLGYFLKNSNTDRNSNSFRCGCLLCGLLLW